MICGFDHVLHAGGFADQHTVGIVLFENGVELIELCVHVVAGHGVFGVDQQQLPAVGFENTGERFGDHFLGNGGIQEGFKSQHIFHAVHIVHFLNHGVNVLGTGRGVHQQHMRGGDVELVAQLGVGDDVLDVLRQAAAHVVVNLVVGLGIAVIERRDQQDEYNEENGEHLHNTARELRHVGYEGLVLGLLQRLVEHENHGGQHGDAADDAQRHALGHDQTQIHAQRKAHEAQRRKTGDCRNRAAYDADHCFMYGDGHSLEVVGGLFTLLVVAVPQENGVVHRDGQLEHGGQRLGDIGDLAEEVVRSEIDQDRNADVGQKHERHQPAVKEDYHGRAGQYDGDGDVDRLFLLAQILQICDQRGHTAHEYLLAGNGADLADRVHGHVGGGGAVKEHGHQRRVAVVELVVDLVRQHFHRDGQIED